MNSFVAFARGEAARASGAKQMVFDWDEAARIIAERKPDTARAGLRGDWEYTGGAIWENGKPVPKEETYVYLSSNWATPELEIDGELVPCFCYREDWDSDTYWPESAKKIAGL